MACVLIVEDEVDISDFLKLMCEECGVRAIVVDSATAADEKLRNQKFDLVFLDINLRRGTGVGIVEKIRGDRHLNQETPVILTSGNIDKEVLDQIGKKIQGAIVKPIMPKKISETLLKYIIIKDLVST